jgi:hypothetical protein
VIAPRGSCGVVRVRAVEDFAIDSGDDDPDAATARELRASWRASSGAADRAPSRAL